MEEETKRSPTRSKKRRITIFGILGLVIVIWILVRPGVFTVQPIGALPGGITVIYHSRNNEMPFFSSPDGLCLEIQGSVVTTQPEWGGARKGG